MKVIPHPTVPGHWTILIGRAIYGCHARRDLAISIMLTYNGR